MRCGEPLFLNSQL